jgi:hypothetical protein
MRHIMRRPNRASETPTRNRSAGLSATESIALFENIAPSALEDDEPDAMGSILAVGAGADHDAMSGR